MSLGSILCWSGFLITLFLISVTYVSEYIEEWSIVEPNFIASNIWLHDPTLNIVNTPMDQNLQTSINSWKQTVKSSTDDIFMVGPSSSQSG
jgi:hypothetical protein